MSAVAITIALLRMVLALPLRLLGWLFLALGLPATGLARLCALLADTIEGEP